MKLIVNPHTISIQKELVNEKEINVTNCTFEFNNIPDNYVKEAYFTYNGTTYKQLIFNNQCDIPYEVLEKQGQIEVGVVAYEIQDEEYVKRFNPSPAYFTLIKGSLKDKAENTEPITPTDKEQIMQALNNMNIDGNKVGKITTITISYKDGTTKTLTLEDGMGLEYNWLGTSLGIKREDEVNYEYVDLKGDKGEPGAIKMVIVNQLPSTGAEDTIYLVPLATPESQRRIHSSLMAKTLSAIVTGAALAPCLIGADYMVQSGSYAAGRIANNLLNRKNVPQEIPLTDTELIELAGLVESLQDKIINAYYNYKSALSQLKEVRSRQLLYSKNYIKAMDEEDFLEIAISSALYKDMEIEEYKYTQLAKKYHLELQRLAGKKVVDKLNLYQYNYDSTLVGGSNVNKK